MSWHVLEDPQRPSSYVRVAAVRRDRCSPVWLGWPGDSARLAAQQPAPGPAPGSPAANQASTASPEVVAAMAARVVLVAHQRGDKVAAGQVLVVLEAMKTELPVLAPQDCSIAQICCAAGDQVDEGQLLLRLEGLGPGHAQ